MQTSKWRSSLRTPHSAIRNGPARSGFTLVEMLTVIGIIVLLMSILLPVVSSVRSRGHQADTQAMLSRIASGIESYHGDFRAYPGPLHNGQIYNGGMPVDIELAAGTTGTFEKTQITMAENLVLGLLGGLRVDATGKITFDKDAVGNGPLSLSPRNPKKSRAYMDKVSLSAGDYTEDPSNPEQVKDTLIPEFLDKQPDPMPILYMRAKSGATGIVSDKKPIGEQEQYDLKQIEAYVTANIGIGREAPSDDEFKPSVPANVKDKLKHGLQKVTKAATMQNPAPSGQQYHYPYDLYGFLRHPSMTNAQRQKDGYILISAGPDRIYGTKDDGVYPPSR